MLVSFYVPVSFMLYCKELSYFLYIIQFLLIHSSIWCTKLSVCEFLKRLSGMVWKRSMNVFLNFIYVFLACTLAVVVIATLAECHPFHHYWQVMPDPGPRCRAGYANLIAMGTCDVITDLLLVAFPVPVILTANMLWKQKIALSLLLTLSLAMVGITCYRVPAVIYRDGSQGYRSLLASMEILAATATSNAVVIGSFIRDRGLKKQKYRKDVGTASVSESVDYSFVNRTNLTYNQWGSDSDLVADLGIRLHPDLHSVDPNSAPRPAPMAIPDRPATTTTTTPQQSRSDSPTWYFGKPLSTDEPTSVSSETKVDSHEYNEKWKRDSHDRAVAADNTHNECPAGVSILDLAHSPYAAPTISEPSNLSAESSQSDSRSGRRGSHMDEKNVSLLLNFYA